jgi:hypothetical protein
VLIETFSGDHSPFSKKSCLFCYTQLKMSLSAPAGGNFCDIKGFLYAWLGKQNKLPSYEVSQQGTKQRIRFKCEVSE